MANINTRIDKKAADLAWYRRVMALSDLGICLVLARIEALQVYYQFGSVRINVGDGDDYYFNPLQDNNQCVAMMIKHNVERTWEPYDFVGWSYHLLNGENPIHITENQDFHGSERENIGFQKAVCLAIILNKATSVMLDGTSGL